MRPQLVLQHMEASSVRAWSRAASVRLEAIALAALSLGAAAIHFAVVADHFAEYALFGVFFSLIGWFQALWAIAYAIRPGNALALLAIAANAATVAIWYWAHAVGLPFGTKAGEVEPTTVTDLMATLFEVLLVAWLLGTAAFARSRRSAARLDPRPSGLQVAIAIGIVVAVALGTTIALSQPKM